MVQRQNRLDHPGSSSSRLGVADLRLDRTEGAPRLAGRTVNVAQRRDLHRITDLGAGAVGFNQTDTVG